MPAGSVADQHSVGVSSHLHADFIEMLVHRLGVRGGHDNRGTDAAGRANRAKQISRIMPVITYHLRARADRRPDVGERALLTDSGLILEPDLDRCASGGGQKRILHQAGEVFLKVSWAAGSVFGWHGLGCNRVRPNWRSHLPTVLSCTRTENRRATSSCRSRQRQRMTLSFSGSGPLTTSALNSTFCASLSSGAAPGG